MEHTEHPSSTTICFGSLPSAVHGLTIPAGAEKEYAQRLPQDMRVSLSISRFCNNLGRLFFSIPTTSPKDYAGSERGYFLKQQENELVAMKQTLGLMTGASAWPELN